MKSKHQSSSKSNFNNKCKTIICKSQTAEWNGRETATSSTLPIPAEPVKPDMKPRRSSQLAIYSLYKVYSKN